MANRLLEEGPFDPKQALIGLADWVGVAKAAGYSPFHDPRVGLMASKTVTFKAPDVGYAARVISLFLLAKQGNTVVVFHAGPYEVPKSVSGVKPIEFGVPVEKLAEFLSAVDVQAQEAPNRVAFMSRLERLRTQFGQPTSEALDAKAELLKLGDWETVLRKLHYRVEVDPRFQVPIGAKTIYTYFRFKGGHERVAVSVTVSPEYQRAVASIFLTVPGFFNFSVFRAKFDEFEEVLRQIERSVKNAVSQTDLLGALQKIRKTLSEAADPKSEVLKYTDWHALLDGLGFKHYSQEYSEIDLDGMHLYIPVSEHLGFDVSVIQQTHKGIFFGTYDVSVWLTPYDEVVRIWGDLFTFQNLREAIDRVLAFLHKHNFRFGPLPVDAENPTMLENQKLMLKRGLEQAVKGLEFDRASVHLPEAVEPEPEPERVIDPKKMVMDLLPPNRYVVNWRDNYNQYFKTRPVPTLERALDFAESSSLFNKACEVYVEEYPYADPFKLLRRLHLNRNYEIEREEEFHQFEAVFDPKQELMGLGWRNAAREVGFDDVPRSVDHNMELRIPWGTCTVVVTLSEAKDTTRDQLCVFLYVDVPQTISISRRMAWQGWQTATASGASKWLPFWVGNLKKHAIGRKKPTRDNVERVLFLGAEFWPLKREWHQHPYRDVVGEAFDAKAQLLALGDWKDKVKEAGFVSVAPEEEDENSVYGRTYIRKFSAGPATVAVSVYAWASITPLVTCFQFGNREHDRRVNVAMEHLPAFLAALEPAFQRYAEYVKVVHIWWFNFERFKVMLLDELKKTNTPVEVVEALGDFDPKQAVLQYTHWRTSLLRIGYAPVKPEGGAYQLSKMVRLSKEGDLWGVIDVGEQGAGGEMRVKCSTVGTKPGFLNPGTSSWAVHRVGDRVYQSTLAEVTIGPRPSYGGFPLEELVKRVIRCEKVFRAHYNNLDYLQLSSELRHTLTTQTGSGFIQGRIPFWPANEALDAKAELLKLQPWTYEVYDSGKTSSGAQTWGLRFIHLGVQAGHLDKYHNPGDRARLKKVGERACRRYNRLEGVFPYNPRVYRDLWDWLHAMPEDVRGSVDEAAGEHENFDPKQFVLQSFNIPAMLRSLGFAPTRRVWHTHWRSSRLLWVWKVPWPHNQPPQPYFTLHVERMDDVNNEPLVMVTFVFEHGAESQEGGTIMLQGYSDIFEGIPALQRVTKKLAHNRTVFGDAAKQLLMGHQLIPISRKAELLNRVHRIDQMDEAIDPKAMVMGLGKELLAQAGEALRELGWKVEEKAGEGVKDGQRVDKPELALTYNLAGSQLMRTGTMYVWDGLLVASAEGTDEHGQFFTAPNIKEVEWVQRPGEDLKRFCERFTDDATYAEFREYFHEKRLLDSVQEAEELDPKSHMLLLAHDPTFLRHSGYKQERTAEGGRWSKRWRVEPPLKLVFHTQGRIGHPVQRYERTFSRCEVVIDLFDWSISLFLWESQGTLEPSPKLWSEPRFGVGQIMAATDMLEYPEFSAVLRSFVPKWEDGLKKVRRTEPSRNRLAEMEFYFMDGVPPDSKQFVTYVEYNQKKWFLE